MNKKLAGWLALAGFLGTIGHTCIMYFSNFVGLHRVNIAGILGSPVFSEWIPPMFAANWLAGMAFHFALGVVFFPLTYAVIFGRRIDRTSWWTGLLWGWALWAAGQFVFMPIIGMVDFFLQNPTAVLSYFVGHTAYGALFGLTLARYTKRIRTRDQLVEKPEKTKVH